MMGPLMRRPRRGAALCLCVALLWVPGGHSARAAPGEEGPAPGQQDPDPERGRDRPDRLARWTGGLSWVELGLLGGAATANLALYLARPGINRILDRPEIPPPGPGSIDRVISDALYHGPEPFQGGFANTFSNTLLPTALLAFYGGNPLVYWISGRSVASPRTDQPSAARARLASGPPSGESAESSAADAWAARSARPACLGSDILSPGGPFVANR